MLHPAGSSLRPAASTCPFSMGADDDAVSGMRLEDLVSSASAAHVVSRIVNARARDAAASQVGSALLQTMYLVQGPCLPALWKECFLLHCNLALLPGLQHAPPVSPRLRSCPGLQACPTIPESSAVAALEAAASSLAQNLKSVFARTAPRLRTQHSWTSNSSKAGNILLMQDHLVSMKTCCVASCKCM